MAGGLLLVVVVRGCGSSLVAMFRWLLFSCDAWVTKQPVAWCSSLVGVGGQLLLGLDELLYSCGVRYLLEFF